MFDNEEIEVKLLTDAIRLKYGYDFSQYTQASLVRRIKKGQGQLGLKKISEIIPVILYEKDQFYTFVSNLSVNVTEVFRDPIFFRALREKVVPYLKTFPFLKIWSVGVATGKEVYSLAILLAEEGLSEKSLIYATDFDDNVLEVARKGIYSSRDLKKSTQNYIKSGGKFSFDNYYNEGYDSIIFKGSLKENIVFANHNLVTDGVFGEMNLILCRNVLIYFNKELQNKVLGRLSESLCPNGFLGLGMKETIDYSDIAKEFSAVDKKYRIYQKKIS